MLDGVKANEDLYTFFVEEVGGPDRTYVWGDSLGGLITQTVAEKHPEWVSGAAPLCGVLAGSNLNLDLALDVAYAVKTLIYPDLKLTGFASHEEAVENWEGAFQAITEAGGDVENGVPAILLTAALVDAPAKTKTYDGSTVESQVRARAESILTRARLRDLRPLRDRAADRWQRLRQRRDRLLRPGQRGGARR